MVHIYSEKSQLYFSPDTFSRGHEEGIDLNLTKVRSERERDSRSETIQKDVVVAVDHGLSVGYKESKNTRN